MTPQSRLAATVMLLEPDAIEVLAFIADRMLLGQKQYGRLDLDNDHRDFEQEALEEDADGLVYRAAHAIRAARRYRGRRL